MRAPSSSRLSFRLEGSAKDSGYVRANEFVTFLDRAISLLRRLEGGANQKPRVVYRIVDLEIGSALMTLEAETEQGSDVDPSEVIGRFAAGVAAYRDGVLDRSDFDRDTQQAFAEMLSPMRRNLRSFTVAAFDEEITVTQGDLKPFHLREETETAAVGRFSGFVEAVNVHSGSTFYLYPTEGPKRIACAFDKALLEEVRGAIKRYTTVFGLLEYPEGSAFPSRIVVERLEVNPPGSELPTLRSLRGIAPNLTRGVDAVTFVRTLRDAED